MTNAELIAKIKAEIERRITDNTFGAKLELIDILAWLDTLESEKTISPWKKIHTYTEEIHEGDMEKMLLELSVGKGEKRTKTALPDRIVDFLESEKPIDPDAAMKELDEKIALVKQRGTWDGVDVDKYMDEVRGREPEKPMEGLDEEIDRLWESFADEMEGPHNLFDIYARLARHFAQWGAERQKEQDDKEQADLFTIVALDSAQRAKEQMMENYPKWRRIKAGERLPCPAYVWTIAYDNYPDCFEGRLMPNIQGVKVGRDTWYIPVDVIHNLPKED